MLQTKAKKWSYVNQPRFWCKCNFSMFHQLILAVNIKSIPKAILLEAKTVIILIKYLESKEKIIWKYNTNASELAFKEKHLFRL